MDLNKKIEIKREVLNELVKTKGVMNEKTIKLSQELDDLIVERMRSMMVSALC